MFGALGVRPLAEPLILPIHDVDNELSRISLESGRMEMQRRFYQNLVDTVSQDISESNLEDGYNETLAPTSQLGQFEFKNFDNNGFTRTMEENMKRGLVYFKCRFIRDWGAELRVEYGHLVPTRFLESSAGPRLRTNSWMKIWWNCNAVLQAEEEKRCSRSLPRESGAGGVWTSSVFYSKRAYGKKFTWLTGSGRLVKM